MRATIVVPGYEYVGDWLVAAKDRTFRDRICSESPPRAFGPLDQLRDDLTEPRSVAMYAFLVAAWAYIAATRRYGFTPIALVLTFFMVRAFPRVLRLKRHGAVTTVRFGSVDHVIGSRGVTENVVVDGIAANVSYELLPVKTILAASMSVEVQVIYLPNTSKRTAMALAYRTAT